MQSTKDVEICNGPKKRNGIDRRYDFLAPIFAAASIQRRRHFYEFFCTQR